MKSLNISRYYFKTTIPLLDNISFTIDIVYNRLGDNTSSRLCKMAESSTFDTRAFQRQPSCMHNVFRACPIHLQTSAGSLKGSFINPIHCNDFSVKIQDETKLPSPTALIYRRSPQDTVIKRSLVLLQKSVSLLQMSEKDLHLATVRQ